MIFDRSRATPVDALCQHQERVSHYKNVRVKGLTEFFVGRHTTFLPGDCRNKQLQLQLKIYENAPSNQ
jgi:hypothetical protein